LICFIGVTKIFEDPKHGARLLLRDVTAAIPGDRFCEIESEDNDPVAKTLLLRLASGAVRPDRGRIYRKRLRVSPLINAGNIPTLVFNQMTLRQNISFQAKLANFDAKRLTEFVAESCSLQDKVDKSLAHMDWPTRRAIEATIFTAIPYDCYLIDYVDFVPDFAQMQLYFAAKQRGAGMLFASLRPAVARAYRDMSVVVRGGELHGVSHAVAP
jgi:ABC-type polysaccharide/polyol phosphate transport system ATPase subunit